MLSMKNVLRALLTFVLLFSLVSFPASAETVQPGELISENGFVCERQINGGLALIRYEGDAAGKTVNIPDQINGYHVEAISAYAFDGCAMNQVRIPDTVRMIEAFAFNDCTAIQAVSIPDSVTFISGNPFTGCTALRNIKVDPLHPTLQRTSDGALYSKRNKMILCYPYALQTKTYTVMNETLAVGKAAFYGCDRLETIQLPASVREIEDDAFSGCRRLVRADLPESVLFIGRSAFSGCRNLRSLSLPAGIIRIESGSFEGCERITEVRIPETVHSIGDKAFYGYRALTDAFVPVGVTEIGDGAFDACSVDLYLHLGQHSFAVIYARNNDLAITYDTWDLFLTEDQG